MLMSELRMCLRIKWKEVESEIIVISFHLESVLGKHLPDIGQLLSFKSGLELVIISTLDYRVTSRHANLFAFVSIFSFLSFAAHVCI